MIELRPQTVSCTHCGASYVVDPELLPSAGALVLCRRCGTRFAVYPQPQSAQHTPGPAPEARSKRFWIFPDDPALQREGVLPCLRAEMAPHRVHVLDTETRQIVRDRAETHPNWPDVLLFGDMHVLLEDRLLQQAASLPGVHRILVSTHYNAELVKVAREYCGFDRHLVLPIAPAQVREALGALNRGGR